MNLNWYLNRLRKMSLAEIIKRCSEYVGIYYSQIKYHDPAQWPYSSFACSDATLILHRLPGFPIANNRKHYRIYNFGFDLTQPVDWYFSDRKGVRWPAYHYSRINYRPGNPYGDVRINWELNRLQFLPSLAVIDDDLTRSIIKDWLMKNPYLHGPGYLASMEVALRWFSIYWAVCLFKRPIERSLMQDLTGLALASGRFIEKRLSTHSSAGNHLIVEAVGLFWLGKALENDGIGFQWITKAREILANQIPRQINSDGSNKEQSFWYLGFVFGSLYHYFLLEDSTKIPLQVYERVQKLLEFMNDMTLSDGSFPDYGDRDDGFVFRPNDSYDESPFTGLLNIGSFLLKRPEFYRNRGQAEDYLTFWKGEAFSDIVTKNSESNQPVFSEKPHLKTYSEGGMTLMQWGKGRLLFRHAPLGLYSTFGHGHADALSVLFYWDNIPVLIDLGSGQYNGDQQIRDFFRSTIAHNTVEIGGKNQSKILGPFMWEKSYETNLENAGEFPFLFAQASHNGYVDEFSIIHSRKIEWHAPNRLEILDSFLGPGSVPMRGAFHLGRCQKVSLRNNTIDADFRDFVFSINLPLMFSIKVYYGSEDPFIGWRSTLYGNWEPIYSLVFFNEIRKDFKYRIGLEILEK